MGDSAESQELETTFEASVANVCDCGNYHSLVDDSGNSDTKTYVFSDGKKLVAKASDAKCKSLVASRKVPTVE